VGALPVVVPILAVLGLNLAPRGLARRLGLAAVALLCVVQAAAVLGAPADFWSRPALPWPMLDPARILGADFRVDALARVLFLAIALVGLASAGVAHAAGGEPEDELRFANLLLLAIGGMNGLVLARDLFVLYVFLEVTSVASIVLIVVDRRRPAWEGAFKYFVLSSVATAFLLAGVAMLWMVAGDTGFDAVAAALRERPLSPVPLAGLALFVGGLAIKAGVAPFHGWLPDAYSSAPPAVSVLLAGIVSKTTGVYGLIRVVEVFGHGPAVRQMLLASGALSVLVGAFAALGQRDLKRMLAYSSVSQVGYVLLGLGAGPGLGVAAATLHLFNHAVFKSLLFVNAAAVEQQAGTRDMDRLGGLAARMPVTGVTSIVGMLSTAGLPPFSGFWSKLLVVVALWQAGLPALAALAVLASVLTLAYLLSMQRRVFFGPVAAACAEVREASLWVVAPAVMLAAITLGLGLAMPWLFETFLLPVGSIL
jgi:proton-translocating NADH-quinone oxidoreductase chain N